MFSELEAARYWTVLGLGHDDAAAWKQLLKICIKQSDQRGKKRAKDNMARIRNASGPESDPLLGKKPEGKRMSGTQLSPDIDNRSSASNRGSEPHLKRSSSSVHSRVLMCIVLAALVCMRPRTSL